MYPENNYESPDATMLDGTNNEESTASMAAPVQVIDDGNGWQKVAIGAGAGILLGSVATLLTSSAIARPAAADAEVDEETASEDDAPAAVEHPAYVDETIAVATAVSDDMSFSQAFAAARAEVGTAGAFEWRGNVYSTFTADEWDNMTAQEHAEYGSHFNWSAHEGATTYASHNAAPTNVVEAAAPTAATAEGNVHPALADGDVQPTIPDSEIELAEPSAAYTHEVEVLGVVHDMRTGMNVGGAMVDGQEFLLVDANGDEIFDIAMTDVNGDGEIQEDEVADISQGGVTVDDFGGVTTYVDDMFAGMDDEPVDDGLFEV